jgi:hypothetical protein
MDFMVKIENKMNRFSARKSFWQNLVPTTFKSNREPWMFLINEDNMI